MPGRRRLGRARTAPDRVSDRAWSVAPVLGLEVVDGHVAPLPGPNPHGLLDGEDEDLAVADLAGAGGGGDRLHHRLHSLVPDDRLDLYLPLKRDVDPGAPVHLGVAPLAATTQHLGDRQA